MVQASLEKVIVIVGATASGKSRMALELALQQNGEIISADSAQVYIGMDIGTAKATKPEQAQVRHHLLDIVSPDYDFSVSDFVNRASESITDIISRGKTPIIAGGTGLYIKSLLYNYNFNNTPRDNELREKLKADIEKHGNEFLHDKLKSLDAVSAQKISVNDTKRIIRALEIVLSTNAPRQEQMLTPRYNHKIINIELPREELYSRINTRVDGMFKTGLADEVKSLMQYQKCNSMRAIGYAQLVQHFNGQLTLQQAVDAIKQATRNYAKRQITFFKNSLQR